MEHAMKAIELTGTVDEQGILHLDSSLVSLGEGPVRVILLREEEDVRESEWLRAAASNPAFDFLKDPEEDIYSPADGKPFDDQG